MTVVASDHGDGVTEYKQGGPLLQIPGWMTAVGPGWCPLLKQLHTGLKSVYAEYHVSQVKQKFGYLCVYVQHPLPAEVAGSVNELVEQARSTSVRTCEFCGRPGHRRRSGDRPQGYIETVCADCHPNRSAKRVRW